MDRLRFHLARATRNEAALARRSITRSSMLAAVAGRSVALVGNARSLAQGAAGDEIDAHDLVIRINRAPMPAAASHGTRTDWLALAVRMGAADLDRLNPRLTLWMSHKRKRLTWAVVRRRFYLHRQDDIRRLWAELGAQPTTGLMLIDLLAGSEATRIDLYGFDFFQSLSLTGHRSAAQVPHDFAAERAAVEQLLAADPRFRLIRP
ncbi:MAG: hypothetical protein GC186_19050 [Rhodobacteraceae bacterium]|nr:hypothetical protein [Paracoccaceae bacterium]